jgi:hypothetical protein
MSRPTVFLSYSYRDEDWKTRLERQLRVLDNEIDVWSDRRIGAEDDWLAAIESAIARAQTSGLLVTTDLLMSEFVRAKEVPQILERQQADGMLVRSSSSLVPGRQSAG